MKRIDDLLYECTNLELKKCNASDFEDNSNIWVRDHRSKEFKYVIELRKGEFKTFSMKTRVMDANTHEYLSCTAGSRRPFTPYYIKDFIYR